MLKELKKSDWLSFLNIPEEMVPRVLLLRGTRNLRAKYEKHKAYFKNPLELDSPNSIIEDVLIGQYKDILVGYASVYGDAMASEVTHIFGALGSSLAIQTGCCGGLGEDVSPGDIVCATSAYCGEGASQYYQPKKREIGASKNLVDMVTAEKAAPVSLHKGPVWTTSALLAEGRSEIQGWRDQGCIAVDMETATTFAVAEYFKMHRLSLLFVFDAPQLGEHILLADSEKEERRARGEQAVIDLAFSMIESYNSIF